MPVQNGKNETHRIDQKVVVTGASGGVGRAIVRQLARRGCSIGLVARGPDALDAAAREVEQLGGRAIAVTGTSPKPPPSKPPPRPSSARSDRSTSGSTTCWSPCTPHFGRSGRTSTST